VTASIGIASSEAFGYDLDGLLHEADMAAYAAKRQGRNQVMVGVPEVAEGGLESQEMAPAGGRVAFSRERYAARARRKA
jgi:predicted signal transduction protein with EAL and GGDEF domain